MTVVEKETHMSTWSLVRIPLSDLTPTLEILSSLGVDQRGFEQIRRMPTFAREISLVFGKRQKLIDDAINGHDARLIALESIFDKETLVYVALNAKEERVALWILSERADGETATAIAKGHESRTVVEAALRKVPTITLESWNDGKDNYFSWVVEKEIKRRDKK